ncbi:ATP-dependent zinc protease [Shewanella sp. VB17]|uniref:ATP-dependent zinc protease family protein n=1 Tax=Shewanella sp. VB17 TaxID=2739432 RepID=UPI00156500C4|nr:RimK/LysX family protein [Shewanella sp. VB17]NRD74105.1 ATP-dependent zinc protease [Shewanella sp. VB17]
MKNKLIVGCLEICHLPELSIVDLQVRIDTGAKTSSLHVDNIVRFNQSGKPWVSFDIHPDIYEVEDIIQCKAKLCDTRRIKSSNGAVEERYIIETMLALGNASWPIQLSLTNRADMSYLMLLGREAMADKVLVDPSQNYLTDRPLAP